MVERINLDTLKNLIDGNVKEDATCMVKFYSTRCPYCDNLKPDYETLSQQYGNIHFFAINVDGYPEDNTAPVKINGVPTVCMIKIRRKTKVTVLEDPKMPHPEKWYWLEYIKEFIDKEIRR